MPTDTTGWTNLTTETGTAAKQIATERLTTVFAECPLISMLAPQARASLIDAILTYGRLRFQPDGSLYEYHGLKSRKSVERDVARVVEGTPFSGLWTREFKQHLTAMAAVALVPQRTEYDADQPY